MLRDQPFHSVDSVCSPRAAVTGGKERGLAGFGALAWTRNAADNRQEDGVIGLFVAGAARLMLSIGKTR